MKALYFDCFSGISGDMTIGALIDLGVDKNEFMNELSKLNLKGYEINIQKKEKNGIFGVDVQVVLKDEHMECSHTHSHEHVSDVHEHCHGDTEHSHIHEHQGHSHKHNHNHSHGHAVRNLMSIETIIDSSNLKQSVKDLSKKVFREIARAEAVVHNKDINDVHFHEVGAVDSIVDIVGTAICIDLLEVEKVFSSPLHEGRGFIECQHGVIPVPVPAVMEMFKGTQIPLVREDVNTELVTPTGMGLIKSIASSFGDMPMMFVEKTGYGMGKRETGTFNALRVVMGTLPAENKLTQKIVMLETNIDDMNPEIMGFVSEKLLKSGALDVYHTPIYMKKNRPAVMLTVLSSADKEQKLVDIILKETSTFGVRRSQINRYCLERETISVPTQYGDVRVKVSSQKDYKKFSPEYEDCKKIVEQTGMTMQHIYDMVKCEYLKLYD